MSDLFKLERAAASLEEHEEEYSSDTLVSQSGLSLNIIKDFLKKQWISNDSLNIFYLKLAESEESELWISFNRLIIH